MRTAMNILPLLALPLAGCLLELPGQPCTDLYAYGVSVSATNAATGAALENATLTLTDGAYTEALQAFPTGDYVGAGERPGTYTLTATAAGFQPQTIENIVVTADRCHVHGVHVDVALQPAP